MLLSYVRENSWSSREGQTAKLPQFTGEFSFRAYDFRTNRVEDNTQVSLDEWSKENSTETNEHKTWAQSLPDTRVDVNEFIEAAIAVSGSSPKTEPSLFFESLFLLVASSRRRYYKSADSERCTFVRCRFEAENVDGLSFLNSRLINSTISSRHSKLQFQNCVLINVRISEAVETEISADRTTITDSHIADVKETSIRMAHCDLVEGSISSKDGVRLIANRSAFLKTSFWNQSFTAASRFQACAFVGANFSGADLSEVQDIKNSSLEHAIADPSTIPPKIIDRPSSWPEFDPSYKDDEIPF